MTNKKPCSVCTYLKIYTEDFVLAVNSLMVSNGTETKLKDLLSSSKVLNYIVPPTFYKFKIHRDNCLIGFVAKVEDIKNISVKNDYPTSVDLQVHLDEYEKMSVQERDNSHIERLRKIKYLSGVVILQELLSGKHSKSIPKEDISALKQVEDIIQSIKITDIKGDGKINFFLSVKENENLIRMEENKKGFTDEEKAKSLKDSQDRVMNGENDPRWKRMNSNR